MKNKIVISILGLLLVGSLVGCSFNKTNTATSAKSEEQTETTVTTEEVSSDTAYSDAASASAAYKELTIKTDWDSKATVTFSSDGMTIDGSGCSNEDDVLYITEGGAYTLTGTSDNASILINTDENVKLILNGVELKSAKGPVIYGQQVKNLYIETAAGTTNSIEDASEYETDAEGNDIGKAAISCNDDLIFLGEGTLNVTGNYKHSIACDDKLYIESGTINVVSNVKDGIRANDLLSIDGGTVNVTSENEGIESKSLIFINGGDITVDSADDGINASCYIEINGGTVTVKSTNNDAIDSNGGFDGCLTINDGVVNATGAGMPDGALDADESSVIINGGKVTATGGCNSPIIENGGDNNITGDTFSGGGMGGQGDKAGPGGQRGQGGPSENGDFDPNNLPEDFDPENRPEPPENGEKTEATEGSADNQQNDDSL
ncbi:carbohydrate-binding domain-containing protein [Pseudobutyrivibrio xylanivorans]|uniref:Carbohydrate-binding domain-containing protein n=1 Tax=Pseudobutyrivibrio xylanivorans DSM 14809 TaxID=1123012 RepID=A0A1M6ELZ1_PSEXY|nr:carbohydrate-binding domain-containing protein [Pseudobutyrivibrio xylanivorans]SHI86527.1 protein of unknown function [Pseudobutyrivibrio xylanivorans DSM 14809]